VEGFLIDLQAKLEHVEPKKIIEKLEADEAVVSQVAAETLHKVQQAVGLRPA
jgi:hypothetical protein